MSRAVWLRVFLTPALIPLWIWRQVQDRSCRKQDTEVIIDFLVPNIQCQCLSVCLCTRYCACVGAPGFAQTRSVLHLQHGIKIHGKVTKTLKWERGFESHTTGREVTVDSQSAADLANKQTSHGLHHHTARWNQYQMQSCKPVWRPEVGGGGKWVGPEQQRLLW